MKKILFFLTFGLMTSLMTMAQLVVVMNKNYTYTDPRWEQDVTLDKGQAITVTDAGGDSYEYWPYPAADVAIPKKVTHIPGTVKGERCLVINTSKVRFLEKPSAKSRVYCYNVENTASIYHNQFINMSRKPSKDDFGLEAKWDPMTLPRGTKIPYKGKSGNFYKTEINGTTFYISAKQANKK